MKLRFSSVEYKLLYYFYPLFCILCLLQVMGIIPPYYPGTGMASWPLRLVIIYLGLKSFLCNSRVNALLTSFFLYTILTVFGYLFNGRPFSLYVIEFVAYATPMLFAFIALDKRDFSDKFYSVFLTTIIICFVFGFYLHFMRPSWYQVALTETYNDRWYVQSNYDYEQIADSFRFSSIFLNSYAISHFSMFAFPISVTFLLKKREGKKWKYIIFAIISFVSAIICLHRVAMASCVLMLFVFILYDFRHGRKLSSLAFWIIVLVLIALFYLSTTELFEQVIERFSDMNISDAFDDSRTNQNISVLREWNNIIFGEGIGAMSADARKIGYVGITDGQYIKILVEQGLIGFSLYVALIIGTLFRGLKYFKYYSIEFCIILGISIAMIGSDSLVMPFYILPFWFAVGRIWNKDYLRYLKETNNHI